HILMPDGVTVVQTSSTNPALDGGTDSRGSLPAGRTLRLNSWGMGFGSNSSPTDQDHYDVYTDAVKYTTIVPGPKVNQKFDSSPSNWQQLGSPGYGFSNTNNTAQESPAGEAGGT